MIKVVIAENIKGIARIANELKLQKKDIISLIKDEEQVYLIYEE